jgi:hypothetical protein
MKKGGVFGEAGKTKEKVATRVSQHLVYSPRMCRASMFGGLSSSAAAADPGAVTDDIAPLDARLRMAAPSASRNVKNGALIGALRGA